MSKQHTDYVAHRTNENLEIDGDLTKPVWQKAQKSKRFVDMATGHPGFYDTRMACTWNSENLYIAFWVEEPYVQAQLAERDDIIFRENDVEIFIDGGDCYYELELNALGTIYEMMFIWRDAYQKKGRFDVPEFDVIENNAYSFGGDFDRQPESFWDGTHPRGTRWAFRNWDMPGLQVGVQVQGKINDSTHVDEGWTAEIAIPWKSMKWLSEGRPLPPQDGDTWKIFFGRFQKLLNAGEEVSPHPAWVLKPHGKYDTHQPEQFPNIQFTDTLLDE
ncbi:MAG: carbohydrate-binding family 9-like protein [Roseovarius sp.]|nr:carbohydrate-binding family 9-like protein [Roseovarius sp.]